METTYSACSHKFRKLDYTMYNCTYVPPTTAFQYFRICFVYSVSSLMVSYNSRTLCQISRVFLQVSFRKLSEIFEPLWQTCEIAGLSKLCYCFDEWNAPPPPPLLSSYLSITTLGVVDFHRKRIHILRLLHLDMLRLIY